MLRFCGFWGNDVIFDVRVKPNSKKESVKFEDGAIVVKVKEKPIEGKANQSVINKLAKMLGIAKSCIRIVSGEKSRVKRISIDCVDEKRINELIGED